MRVNNKTIIPVLLVVSVFFWAKPMLAEQAEIPPVEQSLQENVDMIKNYYELINEKMQRQPQPQRSVRPGYQGEKRDPFSPTRQIHAAQKKEIDPTMDFQPLLQTRIPRMSFRGLINQGEDQTVALLEIEGNGMHIVREGDAIGIYGQESRSIIRVRAINRLSLEIETGLQGQIIIVR